MTLDDLRRNRNLLFWALHTLGWSAYLITQYLGALLYEKPTSYIKVVFAAAAGGFVLSAPLRYLYRWLWKQRPAVIVPSVLLAAWVTALCWRVIINSSYMHWVESEKMAGEPWYGIFVGTLSSTYLLLCWSGLYFGIKYYETLQSQRESVLRASALAQEAQVKMLRYQLNPHFLFNTLNAISTLILDGQGKVANQAVGRLSDFLRYTLDQDPMKKVTLRHELDALNLYLGIEQLRFGDRLRLEFDIDERVTSALVPSLILQPLVENALKYAVAPREEGGRLRIEAREVDGRLRLVVQDDGPGLPVGVELGAGRGVGFRNTRERLAVLYGEQQQIAVRFSRPGLRLEITLPLELATQPT
ncbi:MAG TPA: histidine kinase [Steroidobacteraceae bacterium]|nr:histidine kinase [Steroidobacteraceae bacterium]